MLEHLSICGYDELMAPRENPGSADNQQERLLEIGWTVGFVDGEGCFSVGFIKQPDRETRKGYKLGIQVWCEFAVTQGESSLQSLERMQKFFGVGAIYLNRRYDNHKEHLYRYTVRKRSEIRDVIIPFFQQYQLRTAKRGNFEKFCECFALIEAGEHLTIEGLQKIEKITAQMNHRKDRSKLLTESSTTKRVA